MCIRDRRNDINFAIPLLEHMDIEKSSVLADRGYDSQNLIDYIYEDVYKRQFWNSRKI